MSRAHKENDGVLNGAEIRPVEGKGLGIVATQSIRKGQPILLEHPFLQISAAQLQQWTVELNVFRRTRRLARDLENFLCSIIQAQGVTEQFWELCDSFAQDDGTRSAAGVMLSNSLSAGPALEDSAMLAVGSRFNHSCTPNVCYSWQDNKGKHLFHAARDIAAGEEVTISYVPLYRTSADRVWDLSRRYRFQCHCAGCAASSIQHDSRRTRMQQLEQWLATWDLPDLPEPQAEAAKLQQAVEEIVDLIDLELGGNPKLKARAHCAALQALLELDQVEAAERMLQLAQEQATLAVGGDGEWSPSIIATCTSEDDIVEHDACVKTEHKHGTGDQRKAVESPQSLFARGESLKTRFRALRGSKGNFIDFQEFTELLLRGRPGMAMHYVQAIFNALDPSRAGKIDFDQLVDFLYAGSAEDGLS